MTQRPSNSAPNQQPRKSQGLPVRSRLRAGIVLQIDIPAITAVQQEAQTAAATTTTAATTTV